MPAALGRRAELAALVALCFFLPLYEAPKNLAWAAYVLLWLANRLRARNPGGPWDAWDTLIALWIASVFVIAPFAAVHHDEWRPALDVLRYGVVLWLLKRSDYVEYEWRWPLGALIASALVGLAIGYAKLWTGTADMLQLNSVGHVNHSAIYLAIVLGLATAWFLAGGPALLLYGTMAVLLAALFTAASRAAMGAGLATAVMLALVAVPRSRRRAAMVLAGVVVAILIAVLGATKVYVRQQELAHEGNTLNFRAPAWQLGLQAWREHPWFGLGMDNFNVVTRARDEAYGKLVPHAHSLYLNTLVERGIVGAAALAAVLVAWTWALWRRPPRATDDRYDWLLWGAAASAWLVTGVVGLVNTTLHHEHGLLAMLLLGFWLARADRR
jgi:O-antigen ligase